MSFQEHLIKEITQETNNSKRIIERFKQEHWNWKPHEKSMSAGLLAAHIVELHNWIHLSIQNNVFDFQKDYHPPQQETFEELIKNLEESLEKNIEFVKNQPKEFWSQEWMLQAGDQVFAKMPKAAVYRYIITNHLIHHRGQLSVYLRMLDIPLPGIYGPSADEK